MGSPLDPVVEEGGEGRLAHPDVLELDGTGEPLEEGLAGAEGQRGDDDGEFVHRVGLQGLADDRCSPQRHGKTLVRDEDLAVESTAAHLTRPVAIVTGPEVGEEQPARLRGSDGHAAG